MEETTIEQLQEELAKSQERATANLAGWQRAQADYSNLVKEQDKKSGEIVAWANAMLLGEILPVYNHFKLALKHIPEEAKKESWLVGLEMIQKQFQDFLKKYQIEEIKTLGEKFNPNLHEALTHEEKEGYEAEQIFEEVAPGYLLGDKVLIPAKVKVAK
jgi:molecular chaperone GrpE